MPITETPNTTSRERSKKSNSNWREPTWRPLDWRGPQSYCCIRALIVVSTAGHCFGRHALQIPLPWSHFCHCLQQIPVTAAAPLSVFSLSHVPLCLANSRCRRYHSVLRVLVAAAAVPSSVLPAASFFSPSLYVSDGINWDLDWLGVRFRKRGTSTLSGIHGEFLREREIRWF